MATTDNEGERINARMIAEGEKELEAMREVYLSLPAERRGELRRTIHDIAILTDVATDPPSPICILVFFPALGWRFHASRLWAAMRTWDHPSGMAKLNGSPISNHSHEQEEAVETFIRLAATAAASKWGLDEGQLLDAFQKLVKHAVERAGAEHTPVTRQCRGEVAMNRVAELSEDETARIEQATEQLAIGLIKTIVDPVMSPRLSKFQLSNRGLFLAFCRAMTRVASDNAVLAAGLRPEEGVVLERRLNDVIDEAVGRR